jgi:hypothetical protein
MKLPSKLRRKPQLKVSRFIASWQELQGYCKDKATWPSAITSADKLLDAALKKKRFKGKTMGERLVAAQNNLSDNDMVWTAHNMAKRVSEVPNLKLRERDVKLALIGFRQALKDLGAFSPDATYVKDLSAPEPQE